MKVVALSARESFRARVWREEEIAIKKKSDKCTDGSENILENFKESSNLSIRGGEMCCVTSSFKINK